MRKIKFILSTLTVLTSLIIFSGYSKSNTTYKSNTKTIVENKLGQSINLFVTHGHCSTPFSGTVNNLDVNVPLRFDGGNPLEKLSISFEIDPDSFIVNAAEELTAKIKTPGLFIGSNDEKIIFKSTNIYTMGIDWYQINGVLSIKGVEKEVKLFASGIRGADQISTSMLILEGRMNLFDWDIDYDKIVNGKSGSIATKWMHFNMKVNLFGC
ncbi:MAG: YceI family protein [Polaribacter sp.]|uniref:YceI family protein n=1 Tax=Polaribacter sp. TaxID=1920175 RepID=UPI0032661E37